MKLTKLSYLALIGTTLCFTHPALSMENADGGEAAEQKITLIKRKALGGAILPPEWSFEKTKEVYTACAALGDAKSQYQYAIHVKETGAEIESIFWFFQSAEKNHKKALWKMASLYHSGGLDALNGRKLAIEHTVRAIVHGSKKAQAWFQEQKDLSEEVRAARLIRTGSNLTLTETELKNAERFKETQEQY
jgi:TPR repeat protein